jgi:omega-amidase
MLFYFWDMASSILTVGLVQFDISWENPRENMKRIEQLISDNSSFDLLLLPEMWSTGFTMQPEKVAEDINGPALQWMREQATKRNTCIGGSVSVSEKQKYFNRWYCAYPDGRIAFYDKKHLFSYGSENEHYASGEKSIVIEIKGWRIMPIVCYDLRFPVWCRNKDGYDLLIVAANWPTARIHHWDALIKARSIENQAYVAAVNRIGRDATGLEYNGHSQILDMTGQELLSLGVIEGVKSIILDKEKLVTYRQQYPFLKDMDNFSL